MDLDSGLQQSSLLLPIMPYSWSPISRPSKKIGPRERQFCQSSTYKRSYLLRGSGLSLIPQPSDGNPTDIFPTRSRSDGFSLLRVETIRASVSSSYVDVVKMQSIGSNEVFLWRGKWNRFHFHFVALSPFLDA